MKLNKLLLILFFPITLISQHAYIEWNVGAAYIEEIDMPCPGTSVLFGKTFNTENNLLIDAEVGLAFPSIVTAKIGLGKYLNEKNKSAFIVGLRPWPMHLSAQLNLPELKRGQWIISAELGVEELLNSSNLNMDIDGVSLYSIGLISFGYRWNIKSKK